jgi:hypothetical protein
MPVGINPKDTVQMIGGQLVLRQNANPNTVFESLLVGHCQQHDTE